MTEEQIKQIIELLNDYNESRIISMVMTGLLLVVITAFIFFGSYRMQQINKWQKEYKATLTKEQREAINNYKEIEK